ncbi:MAG: hypothetical protein H6R17_4019 [Proteobacteria bacterium]|nr:hypothetical protein [Pseudomonadota bacterium]
MNIQEREQLTRFLEQLAQAQVVQKDSEADALIRATCTRQADAAYLLVQRAMLLEAAVCNSQSEINRLQGELEQARNQSPTGHGGFIDANSWGNSPAPRPALTPAMPPAASALQAAAPGVVAPPVSAWGSGMLGTIATTAAGVVAGSFLFQGIEHLLGNQRPPSGLTDGLNSPVSAPHDIATSVDPQDGTADIFDTSSVDDYIAGDDNA